MYTKTILHLMGMNSTKYGGIEHYMLAVARLCNRQGYRTILQYEHPPKSAAYLHNLEENGVELKIVPLRAGLGACIKRINRLIRAAKPEILVVHFTTRNMLYSAPLLARIWGVRKVIRLVHSLGAAHIPRHPLKQFAHARYDFVLGVSQAITDELLKSGVKPEVVATHYLGLFGTYRPNLQSGAKFRAELNIPPQAVVLGCIAFDSPLKGLDLLLEAFKDIHTGFPNVYLLIIGVNPATSSLPEQAARMGIADHIRWAGIRDEGWQLLNAVNIYVQPSRSEGLPFTIMEAMALQLPVVATRAGGIPEAVIDGETGFLAGAITAKALAAALKRMLERPDIWKAMGQAGYRHYANNFRGEASAQKLVETYLGLPAIQPALTSD